MENKVIITPEELNKLISNRHQLDNLIIQLGQVEMDIHTLKTTAQIIKTQYTTALGEQEKISEELSKKYGDGGINIETGEFTPAN